MKLHSKSKSCGLSLLAGILAGLSASLFLYTLDFATRFRLSHPQLIYFLPLAGLVIGWAYDRWAKGLHSELILDEIHDPKNIVPLRIAPFVFIGTILTHLFGGSAGREGTAVQIGASLADQLSHFAPSQRKTLLVAGAGAGFSAAIGAPWAGMIFGMEVIQVGRLEPFAVLECFLASFAAFYTAQLLQSPHSIFPLVAVPTFSFTLLFSVALAGACFGFISHLFVATTHLVSRSLKNVTPAFRPFLGGIALVGLYYWEGSYRFAGLGIEEIQFALQAPVEAAMPFLKLIFTSLTVGSGFKGGEFVPLVFIGTTLGNVLSQFTPLGTLGFAGALGFAATFAGAANTPLACTVMAMEIFGWRIGPYAFLACLVSFYCSSHKGIYGGQKVHANKHVQLMRIVSLQYFRKKFFRA